MTQSTNSHDAPWLTNFRTEMFSVYTGNARSSCLAVGAVASFPHTRACSTETSVTETVVRPWVGSHKSFQFRWAGLGQVD